MHPFPTTLRFLHHQNRRQLWHGGRQPPTALHGGRLPQISNHHRPRQTFRRRPQHAACLRRHRNFCNRHCGERRHPLPLDAPCRASVALRKHPSLPPGNRRDAYRCRERGSRHLRQNPNRARSPYYEIPPRRPLTCEPHRRPSLHPALARDPSLVGASQRRLVPARLRQSHLCTDSGLPPANQVPLHGQPVSVLRLRPHPTREPGLRAL